MNTIKSDQGENEFSEFWGKFRLSPWAWTHTLVTQFRYMASWILFLCVLLVYLTFFPNDDDFPQVLPLKHYGSINLILPAMILIILLTIRWHRRIPAFFQWLRGSRRLEARSGGLKKEFKIYLEEYQAALLSRKEPLTIGILLALLFLVMGLGAGIPKFIFTNFALPVAVLIMANMLFSLIGFFALGQAGWIAFVTGRQIGYLPRRFKIRIQPRHPDQCGGLKTLGDFCLEAALPLVGGGFLLALIPTMRLLNMEIDRDPVLAIMAGSVVILFFMPLSLASVFAPLWQVHAAMTGEKMRYEDAFASQYNGLEAVILKHTTEKGDLKEAKAAKEKLETLQTVNPQNNPYPVWPFQFTKTVLTLISPQLLQTIPGAIYKVYQSIF